MLIVSNINIGNGISCFNSFFVDNFFKSAITKADDCIQMAKPISVVNFSCLNNFIFQSGMTIRTFATEFKKLIENTCSYNNCFFPHVRTPFFNYSGHTSPNTSFLQSPTKNFLTTDSECVLNRGKRLKPLNSTYSCPRQIGSFLLSFYGRESANIMNKHNPLLSDVSISRSPKAVRHFETKDSKMNNIVQFNNHSIELVYHNGQAHMTLSQIASALEYNHSSSINDILNRNQAEFDDNMTCLVKHGRTRVRIFNREGAWLIGMFARTPKAAEFRKWVLKVLGAVADGQKADKPVVVSEHTRSLPTGKKEIVLSEKSRTEIGGIFKACLPGIIRAEAEKLSQDMIYSEKFKALVREAIREELQLDPAQWPEQNWQLTAHHAIDEICWQFNNLKKGIKQLADLNKKENA